MRRLGPALVVLAAACGGGGTTPGPTPDAQPDAAPDVAPEVEVTPAIDIAPEVEVVPDIAPEVEVGPEVEVVPDVAPEVEVEVSPDLPPDIAPEVEVAPDLPPDIAPEPEVEVEVVEDIGPDAAPDVGPDVPEPDVPEPAPCSSPGDCLDGQICGAGHVCAWPCDGQCGGGGEGACGPGCECWCDDQCFGLGDCCDGVCASCSAFFPADCGCVAHCTGKACGSDGCGGVCGVCTDPTTTCEDGACVPCGDDCPPVGGGPPTFDIGSPSGPWAAFAEFFSKHIVVFGVNVFATATLPDAKMLHAAHMLAQYIDNDVDGVPDDLLVHSWMVDQPGGSSLVMFASDWELQDSGFFESPLPGLHPAQDLWASETHPEGSSLAGGFDATIEEVWHLVSSKGWSRAYPDVFGEAHGSQLADAMDIARGGVFWSVPATYPDEAWYHYDDVTCQYECMAAEYFYWALTSILGAQDYPGRCQQIAVEWELCTSHLVQTTDVSVWELLTASGYALPTILPDGSYGD